MMSHYSFLMQCKTPVMAGLIIASLISPGALFSQDMAEGLADREKITRLESKMLLSQTLSEAEKLVQAGEFQNARKRYEDVIEKTKVDGPNADLNQAAREQLAGLISIQSDKAVAAGEKEKARSLAEEALNIDPNNETLRLKAAKTRQMALSTREKYPDNSVANDELQQRVDRIRRLVYEGDSYVNTGQYARAEGSFNEILRIDPYNTVAISRLKKIAKLKYGPASLRKEAFKEEALVDVLRSWNMRPQLQDQNRPALASTTFEPTNVTKIYDKLESIRIPELNFTDVDVAEAVNYLQLQSKALDPEGEGINFVLKAEPTQIQGGEDAAPTAPLSTLTLDVRDMPLIKILDFIKSLTNLNYKVEEYAVYIFPANETSDVKIVKSFSVPPTFFGSIVTVQDSVNALGANEVKIVGADVKKQLEDKGVSFSAGTSAAYLPKTAKLVVRNTLEQISLIEQLVSKESGETTQVLIEAKFIEFTEDHLTDFSSNLRISGDTNIPAAFIDGVGNAVGFVPPVGTDQVDLNGNPVADGFPDYDGRSTNALFGKVQAGAATQLRNSNDFSGNTLDGLLRLGANRNPAQLGFTGIMGSTGFRYLLTAINSTIGADLMTAPKVTLVNGQSSTIRVVREFFYPTEYEVPELVEDDADGETINFSVPLAIPSTPTDFESKDVGVTLEVKANATPDRRIDLELKPEVIEFQGFIDYGSDINVSNTTQTTTQNTILGVSTGTTITFDNTTLLLTRASNLRPVFSYRSIETKLQVIDGQTVVMAGFIRDDEEEINDKVPFLGDLPFIGRAFRSKSTQSIKRNLVLFITARMVNPDGTPKFLTEAEADSMGMTNLNLSN
jgi:general secretion pathway protein D